MRSILGLLLLLACSPAAAMEWWSFGSTELLGTTTAYGLPMGNDTSSVDRTHVECTVPIPDVILEICIVVSAAPTSTHTRTAKAMIGSTATNLVATVSGATTATCDQGEQVYAAQSDEISIEFSTTGSPTNARVLVAIRHRTDGNRSWLCGGTGDTEHLATGTFYWPFAGTRQISDTDHYQAEIVVPADGEFDVLCIHTVTAPGAAKVRTYTVMNNDTADTDLEVALSGASAVDLCDTATAGQVAPTAGQTISLRSARTGIGTVNDTYGTWSIAWNSTAAKNRYMIPIAVRDNGDGSGATDYIVAWGADGSYTGTEADVNQQSQVKTRILTMYTEINAVGGCSSWTTRLRQNGANTAFSNTRTSAGVSSDTDDLSIADNDLLTYSLVGSLCGGGGGPMVHNTLLVEGVRRRVD